MKTEKSLKSHRASFSRTAILAALTVGGAAGAAFVAAASDATQMAEIVASLSVQRLVVALPDPEKILKDAGGVETGLPYALSDEGLPAVQSGAPDPREVTRGAYGSAELIQKILDDRESYAIGPRLKFLEDGIRSVIANSDTRMDEKPVRFVLVRALDVARAFLPTAGQNTAFIAPMLANFYVRNLELAKAYTTEPITLVSIFQAEKAPTDKNKAMSTAEFGRVYADMLFSFSTSLTTPSSKAILLMKLCVLLAWDLNTDPKRTDRFIGQSLADLLVLENSTEYNGILTSMKKGQEPQAAQLATLRRRVFVVLSQLPERLTKAGVYGSFERPAIQR